MQFLSSLMVSTYALLFLNLSLFLLLQYSVLASSYKTNLCRLVILQKHIIRIINISHFNAHTDPIFKDLSILKFKLQLGQFMYSCKNLFLPPITISPKAINSILTIKEIPRPTVYRIVE